LVARDWNVQVTFKLLVNHAGWRLHMTPSGYVEEVRDVTCSVVRWPLELQLQGLMLTE
jgi:hypothetical protein